MLKIALAQINVTVGAFNDNYKKIKKYWAEGEKNNVDIVIYPELAICGYNPDSLLLYSDFKSRANKVIETLLIDSKNYNSAIIVGGIDCYEDKLYNCCFFIYKGYILDKYNKFSLNQELFCCGEKFKLINFKDYRICISSIDEIDFQVDLVILINSVFFSLNFFDKISNFSVKAPVVYLNLVGNNDGFIFFGGSKIVNNNLEKTLQMKFFEEDFQVIDFSRPLKGTLKNTYSNYEFKYQVLLFSLRDYFAKTGFKRVVIGLSGGIDSIFTSVIALDALGKDKVDLIMLPSKYTTSESKDDCKNFLFYLDKAAIEINIDDIFHIILKKISPYFEHLFFNITEENMQSRIRNVILMSFSNKHNALLLNTSNRSEIAIGYGTLYGDMGGGYSLLGDMYKTDIYQLAQWRNINIPIGILEGKKDIIPLNVFQKEPSAELKYNQKDMDSLPKYEILDQILKKYIEQNLSFSEIVSIGYEESVVKKIIQLVHLSEFKRRQLPISTKINNVCFNSNWSLPIINKF